MEDHCGCCASSFHLRLLSGSVARNGIQARAAVFIDSGHGVLYLAAMSFDPGGCSIAFADGPLANRVFGLEAEEETTFYSMPVGNVGPNNQKAGDAF